MTMYWKDRQTSLRCPADEFSSPAHAVAPQNVESGASGAGREVQDRDLGPEGRREGADLCYLGGGALVHNRRLRASLKAGLPAAHIGSDHFALAAEFRFVDEVDGVEETGEELNGAVEELEVEVVKTGELMAHVLRSIKERWSFEALGFKMLS
ncbi:unnamed protein product [Mortierella alpina]